MTMAWCGFLKAHLLELCFFNEYVTCETHINLLRNKLMPQIEHLGEKQPDWFQQDVAPTHFATAVRDWRNNIFPRWIGRKGHKE